MTTSQHFGDDRKDGPQCALPSQTTEKHESGTQDSMHTRQLRVNHLAREFTQKSADGSGSDSEGKPIFGDNDPTSPLNPLGSRFNARAWATNIAKVSYDRGQEFRRVGLCFENVNVFGYGTPTDFQKTVANIWLALPGMIARKLLPSSAASDQRRLAILRDFDGLILPSEMCVVLGPPGSGCSTLLKTISGDRNGLYMTDDSYFNYNGISDKEMHTKHRGDVIYTAEVDVHFPNLTVGETLTFASRARCQRELPQGISRNEYVVWSHFLEDPHCSIMSHQLTLSHLTHSYCDHLRDVVMAMYGISHTLHTKVGDQFVQGVSGGERKRVSIAEATLSNAPFQCWDK